MENLRPEKQRFHLLHTILAMRISQVAIFVPVNQRYPWGWKSVWCLLTSFLLMLMH